MNPAVQTIRKNISFVKINCLVNKGTKMFKIHLSSAD